MAAKSFYEIACLTRALIFDSFHEGNLTNRYSLEYFKIVKKSSGGKVMVLKNLKNSGEIATAVSREGASPFLFVKNKDGSEGYYHFRHILGSDMVYVFDSQGSDGGMSINDIYYVEILSIERVLIKLQALLKILKVTP